MKFKIKTRVNAPFDQVVEEFNQDLLLFVSPSIPRLSINLYEGNEVGDRIDFSLDFILFKSKWIGQIIENHESEAIYWFVDEGEQMPLGLKYWRHKHIIEKRNVNCQIIDQVDFGGANWLMSWLIFPGLFLQFLFRKPKYRKYFTL